MLSTRTTLGALVLAALLWPPQGLSAQALDTLMATLTGAAVVGGGDENGRGTATFRFDPEMARLCYDLQVSGITEATATHVHRAPAERNGPPVITLAAPRGGTSADCIAVPRTLIDEILQEPAAFYINVHNPDYPSGALRGQLVRR